MVGLELLSVLQVEALKHIRSEIKEQVTSSWSFILQLSQ